jgi:hypothetical protein
MNAQHRIRKGFPRKATVTLHGFQEGRPFLCKIHGKHVGGVWLQDGSEPSTVEIASFVILSPGLDTLIVMQYL